MRTDAAMQIHDVAIQVIELRERNAELLEEIESLRAQVIIAKQSNGFVLLAEQRNAHLVAALKAARVHIQAGDYKNHILLTIDNALADAAVYGETMSGPDAFTIMERAYSDAIVRNARLVAALERIRDHDPHHIGLYYDSHLQIIESMIATAREALQQSTEGL